MTPRRLRPARRAFLQWLGGTALSPLSLSTLSALTARPAGAATNEPSGKGHVRVADGRISLQFDAQMRCRIVSLRPGRALALTGFDTSETLLRSLKLTPPPVPGKPTPPPPKTRSVERFALQRAEPGPRLTPFGPGQQLQLQGRSLDGIEKLVRITLLDAHPGVALLDVSYRNAGDQPVELQAWANASHRLLAAPAHAGGYWTYSGASHADRRDWVQPVKRGFEQLNFLGMNASDYGGSTPVVDVWRRDVGLAVGHLDKVPRLFSLPVRALGDEVTVALRSDAVQILAPGESFSTPTSFLAVHDGDYFAPLDSYRQLMALQGLVPARPPASAYEPIWCAWGYEREFSLPLVRGTLPKVKELGLHWAVLDDGWQRRTGDWTPDLAKFPRGEADMKALVDDIHAQGMKARLWIAPLAVAPGSDELHEHTDMLLLNADGAVQDISWWNSFYLCPAYAKTQQRIAALVTKIIGEWGFDGLKVDGQHLNGVAPCYNPAHKHTRPEDSVEHLSDFYRVLHQAAHAAKPGAVVEVCPCGTGYAFHNMPFMDQAPASDPTSSWQVRHKGKTLKALMGRSSAYAGDHVELSDGGDDFASSVGIGAVVSTKFTWPVDPKPKDSFLLTPEREAHWRHWLEVSARHRLAEGSYRGELYDIAFDKPETHVVEKNGALYYAFYAPNWAGQVELRGLQPGRRYSVSDYVNGRSLGQVSAQQPRLALNFQHALLLLAQPQA